MQKLLCATDLLPKSEAAIERAGLLTQQLAGELTLLHVVAPAAAQINLEHSLQTAITRVKSRSRPPAWHHDVQPQIAVRAGNPARVIVDTLGDSGADLLIIGPHAKRGMRDVLEGTIAEKALSARKSPLLIVQQEAAQTYRNVLFALDLSAESSAAVRAAESLVLGRNVSATVVHVSEPPYQGMLRAVGVQTAQVMSYVEYSRREVAAAVRQLLSRASGDPKRYEVVIADGQPAQAILRAVNVRRPDLLVMGTRGDGRVRRALIGSVANEVLSAVGCDVLVVPRTSAS
ncbi:MAG TPA: universal stress protein [Steroidobacteraceae bacterium]|nr:universal stress protein [Steroidobacteraceae bacterium]